jgi:hypothetical protein
MMTIGDFFTNSPHARPINPRPVRFTAVAKGKILPGGAPNPTGQTGATITAAMIFIGGSGAEAARIEARRDLRERFHDEQGLPLETDGLDLSVETLYQELWRALRQWDEGTRTAGEAMFPTVSLLRELVEPEELRRIYNQYQKYVQDEHPEVVDDKTFRGAERPGAGVAAIASR